MKCAGASHPGLRRRNNEDRIYSDDQRGLFLVIDGVGGQAAGEKAAEIALATVLAGIKHGDDTSDGRIRAAIIDANNEIHRQAQLASELSGMGCVLTLAVVKNGTATIGHVGDTRLYVWRDGKPVKVTHDHSPVGEQEDHGELSEADAMRHPMRNQVYRALGAMPRSVDDEEELVELQHVPLDDESALLLCSDGLTDLVPLDAIADIVDLHAGDPAGVVKDLIDAANRAGGKDNVSVIFAVGQRFASPGDSSPDTTITRKIGPRPHQVAVDSATVPPPDPRAAAGALLRRGILVFTAGVLVGAAAVGAAVWTRASRNRTASAELAARLPATIRVGSGPQTSSTTITGALNQSHAGDTILVEPGEYRESLRVSKALTMISVRPREAVIVSPAGAGSAIEIDAPDQTRLVGFTVRGAADAPLPVGIVLRHGNAQIEDFEISGTRSVAIEIMNVGESTVRGTYLHDNKGTTILIRGAATPRIVHNLIAADTSGAGALPAIEILEGAAPALIGNVIKGFGSTALSGLPDFDRERTLQQNVIVEKPSAPPQPVTRGKSNPPQRD
jgi:serine/threonine protein phosphatase PrpC